MSIVAHKIFLVIYALKLWKLYISIYFKSSKLKAQNHAFQITRDFARAMPGFIQIALYLIFILKYYIYL